jgi:peptide/nickel transport system permease protein
MTKALGLDQPIYERYAHWVVNALHGDLGHSLFGGQAVSTTITQRLPVTLSLVIGSVLVISIIGVGLGVISAVLGGAFARIVDGFSLLGFAVPGFWLGAVLISVFAVSLGWLPIFGYVPLTQSPTAWARSLVLPVVALALSSLAGLTKQTREAMLDALASEHIRMAWASGVPPRYIYYQLALKNAAPVVTTIIGLMTVGLLVGTVFVEQVFALPGLGSSLVNATQQGDLPVVQGITVFFAVIIVLINLIVDVTYSLLDPRVRTS